ncbi:MAG TPA: amino acid adenylation domain-containing protein [Steroidobacteraceae bacterium]|nr:amino acid adenylation domain-containing protein [Steroidobacteraceae bacterium]
MIDVAQRIERSFTACKDENALWFAGTGCTYGELQGRVLAIQGMLQASLSSGERLVGVWADESPEAYASVLAILRSGRAFVPLHPGHPAQRNAGIVRQSAIRTILAADPARAAADSLTPDVRILGSTALSAPGPIPLTEARPDDLAYLLFTSGSTGEPKGVPITRGNLSAFLDSLAASGFGIVRGDRVLQMFDMTFDFSIASYLAPLSCGACVYPLPAGNAKFMEVYQLLDSQKLTVAPLVPSVLNFLKPYFGDIHLPELRLTVLCGEALFADVATQWMRCAPGSRVANFYGPTEATVFAMVYEWRPCAGHGKASNGVVCIGRPMQGNLAIALDEDLNPVADGQLGELCLAGAQLTPGYWRDPARNEEAFFELEQEGERRRFYRTGDLVTRDPDGDFYFGGRIGTQLKLQGYRIELGEIEYHARVLARGHACVVVPQALDSGTELSLVVENFPGDPRALLTALRERVPAYMVPARALTVDRFPMNANGKIDRLALRRALEEQLT